MNWLRRFMMGRYGSDQLCIALLVLSIILSLIGKWTNVILLTFLSIIPLFFSIYRMLSRNIYARRAENDKFLKLLKPLTASLKKQKQRAADTTHRYFACPSCRQELRVPRGKGKINITCPYCHAKFQKKT